MHVVEDELGLVEASHTLQHIGLFRDQAVPLGLLRFQINANQFIFQRVFICFKREHTAFIGDILKQIILWN